MHTDKLIFFFGMCAFVIARTAEADYSGLLGFELMDVCVWVANLYMLFHMRFWDLARILVLVLKGRCCRMCEMKLVLLFGAECVYILRRWHLEKTRLDIKLVCGNVKFLNLGHVLCVIS